MKRRNLIRLVEKAGCELLREGGNHSVYVNRSQKKIDFIANCVVHAFLQAGRTLDCRS